MTQGHRKTLAAEAAAEALRAAEAQRKEQVQEERTIAGIVALGLALVVGAAPMLFQALFSGMWNAGSIISGVLMLAGACILLRFCAPSIWAAVKKSLWELLTS